MVWIGSALAASNPQVQFNFVDTPLSLVIEQLNQSSPKPYQLADDIDELVNMQHQGISFSQAIALIQQQYNLVALEHDDYIVLARADSTQPKSSPQTPTPAPRKNVITPAPKQLPSKHELHIYRPKHVSAIEIVKLLNPNQGGVLEPLSKVSHQSFSNQLLVKASAQDHRLVRLMLREMDHPRQRVRVYSRILIMRKQAKTEMGARLGLRAVDGYTAIAGGSSGAFLAPEMVNRFTNNLAVDFGIVASGGSIASGYQSANNLIELELRALEASGLVDIVATPQVLVNSGQEAFIASGTQIPYTQRTKDGATDVLFKDALLSLRVTPRVEGTKWINLSIAFAMDTVGPPYAGVPAINTNQLDTKIKIIAGRTLILGGIFSQVKSTNSEQVPGLGDIPLIGRLFRRDGTSLEEAELLIFITPELIDE